MHWSSIAPVTVGLALLLASCASQTDPALMVPTAEAPPSLPTATAPPAPTPAAAATRDAPDLSRAHFSRSAWTTDFSRATVPLEEIRSGGPGRDGIPPIDQPVFETVAQADAWLAPKEPVIHLAVGDDVRAYPLQILIWHEIVNDEVGGVPVAVTFCPLCNTAIAFDRRLDGRVLDFGTTGNLRHSDLVMWDRQTESWWQQITGEAIVGAFAGQHLEMLPATIIAWADFRQQFPNGQVLSRNTGFRRSYGSNPYVGYDRIDQSPFLFDGTPDDRLPPMERVVTVSLGGEHVAFPFSRLQERPVITDMVGGEPIVVFYQRGTVSALDERDIATSQDIGTAAVYHPQVDGELLRFQWQDDRIVDSATGSQWNLLGQATAGPLAGKQLEPVVHGAHFWFAWAVFRPETRIAP